MIKKYKIFKSKIEDNSENSQAKLLVYTTFWFIGLEFNLTSDTGVDLDLTEAIQSFTDKGRKCLN